MSYKIIKSESLTTTQWSGGKTTQLAIYPEDAKYADRNFKWRVSTACVDIEESEFTSLPGTSRILMVLDGNIELKHEGNHSATLGRYDQDAFLGDWKTTSKGQVTDFNLMMSDSCGVVDTLHLSPQTKFDASNASLDGVLLRLKNSCGDKYKSVTELYYCVEGAELVFISEGAEHILGKGDVLIITNDYNKPHNGFRIENNSPVLALCVKALICFNR